MQTLVVASVYGLCLLSFLQIQAMVPSRDAGVDGEVVTLYEGEALHEMTEFFNRTQKLPPKSYRFYNKSVAEFVAANRERFDKMRNPYVEIWGMDLAIMYTSMRRFTPSMLPDPTFQVKGAEILSDFKLLSELFELKRRGLLKDEDFFRWRVQSWHFSVWDQEYNYIYGYQGRVKKLLRDTILAEADPRYNYVVSFEALKRLVDTKAIDLPPGG